jgi:hypothetical protein
MRDHYPFRPSPIRLRERYPPLDGSLPSAAVGDTHEGCGP